MFDARPYSAHAWLAAWKYSPKLCWEDMLDEFEKDVEAALQDSHNIDDTLTEIYQELLKVNMPAYPKTLTVFYKYRHEAIEQAKDGAPGQCAHELRKTMDNMVTWLIDFANKEPVITPR